MINLIQKQKNSQGLTWHFIKSTAYGSQLVPILRNFDYKTFFPDPEEAELLAFQLKQLNDYTYNL